MSRNLRIVHTDRIERILHRLQSEKLLKRIHEKLPSRFHVPGAHLLKIEGIGRSRRDEVRSLSHPVGTTAQILPSRLEFDEEAVCRITWKLRR